MRASKPQPKEPTMTKQPIAIIGVGNLLMGDEGVGVHAIQYLEQFEWPSGVELIDAGVPGASLLHIIEDRKLSIIIDCGDFRGKPGEVLVADPKKLNKPSEDMVSLHGMSLLGTLALAEQTGISINDVRLICVQPESVEMGDILSASVQDALPEIHSNVQELLKNR